MENSLSKVAKGNSIKKLGCSRFTIASLFYLTICLIGVFMTFYPTLTSGFSKMQTNVGDPKLVQYFLEHSFQVFFNKNYVGELWSPTFFYPFKNTLALSENLFGTAPLYWLFRGFSSTETAFQLWMICVAALCFFCFVALARSCKVCHILSALGGFLFAFGMPRIAQIGHQQLLPQLFTPLAFLFLWKFLQKPTNKQLCLFLLFSYLQVLSGIYLGWLFLISLAVTLPTFLLLSSKTRRLLIEYFKKQCRTVILAISVWLVLASLLLFPYIKISLIIRPRAYVEVASMLPRLSSWLLPPEGSPWFYFLAPLSQGVPMLEEHRLFMGLVVFLLTIFSVYVVLFKAKILSQERKLLVKVCLIVALLIFAFSLSFFDRSLWEVVYDYIPGAKAIRAVTRICLFFYFYLLVAILLCFDSFLKSAIANKNLRVAAASFVCLLSIVEQTTFNSPSFEQAPYLRRESELQELMAQGCEAAYVLITDQRPDWEQEILAMWAGMKTGVPVINGSSGAPPPAYKIFTKRRGFLGLIHWLGNSFQGRLCVIFSKKSNYSFDQIKPTRQYFSSEKNFTANVFQLPLSNTSK